MAVSEVRALLTPMFRSMLSPGELATLRVQIVPMGVENPVVLEDDDLVESNSAIVRWRIEGERGSSGGLWLEDGPDALVRHVQSDLQDFIAESGFGWGEFRGPLGLP